MQLLNDSASPEDFYEKSINGALISPPIPLPPISVSSMHHSGTQINTHHSPTFVHMNTHSSLQNHAANPTNSPSCYLCTVTCCETVNCSKSAPILAPSGRYLHRANSDMQSKLNCIDNVIQQQQNQLHQNRPSSVASIRHCPMCIDAPYSSLSTYRATPSSFLLYSTTPPPVSSAGLQQSSLRQTTPISSPTPKVKVQNMTGGGTGTGSPLPRTLSRTESSPCGRKTSFREKPKLHIFIPENSNRNIPSPDFSSGSPNGGSGTAVAAIYNMRHSSFTDYTDTCTPPLCSSTTPGSAAAGQLSGISNSDCLPDFPSSSSSTRKVALLTDADYQQLYLTGRGAEKHGFFRKAVPALPIVIAVLFCIFNLILPGSGTLLASLTIILGSQTEYGPGHGYRSFFICFLSAILQFTTAIFVFGWVWSIMWGIVFIKNSLRYGDKRDINTITLC